MWLARGARGLEAAVRIWLGSGGSGHCGSGGAGRRPAGRICDAGRAHSAGWNSWPRRERPASVGAGGPRFWLEQAEGVCVKRGGAIFA
jgi:hypothetical protein